MPNEITGKQKRINKEANQMRRALSSVHGPAIRAATGRPASGRASEDGWILVALNDPTGRRGIWMRPLWLDDPAHNVRTLMVLELCAGREGDDAYTAFSNPSEELHGLFECLDIGRWMLEDHPAVVNTESTASVDSGGDIHLSTGLTICTAGFPETLSPVFQEERDRPEAALLYGFDGPANAVQKGTTDERPLTRDERRELAGLMRAMWTRWAEEDPLE